MPVLSGRVLWMDAWRSRTPPPSPAECGADRCAETRTSEEYVYVCMYIDRRAVRSADGKGRAKAKMKPNLRSQGRSLPLPWRYRRHRVGIRGAACMYICAMAAYRIRLDARHYTQGMYSTYNTHIVETHAYILHSYHIYISIYAAVRAGRVAFCCGWHLRRHCPYLKRHQAALGSLLSRSLRWFGTCCEWDGEDLLLLVRVTWMGYFVRLCSGSRCTTMYRDAVGMYPCMCWGGVYISWGKAEEREEKEDESLAHRRMFGEAGTSRIGIRTAAMMPVSSLPGEHLLV